MIYAGLTGCGKSYACEKGLGFDLDCGITDDIADYIERAIAIANTGIDCLIAGYPWYRKYMLENGVDYIAVLPHRDDRREYRKRLMYRGMSNAYCSEIWHKWDEYLQRLDGEKRIDLPRGGYIADVLLTNTPDTKLFS